MAPSITFSDSYEGCSYQGGAKVLHDLRWVVTDIVPLLYFLPTMLEKKIR
jgi:hypothetical protein